MFFLGFGLVSAISLELVVHSSKWTTGSALSLGFDLVSLISWELVVHSVEWTTSSGPFLAFDLFSAVAERVLWLWRRLI